MAVLFENSDDGFYVLKMKLDEDILWKSKYETVKGHVQGLPIRVGTWFGFRARTYAHPKYGSQLQIERAPVLEGGWNPDSAEKTLVAHGVGSQVIGKIRAFFTDSHFLEALGDEKKLEEVPGIDGLTAHYVVERWDYTQVHFRTLDFLSNLGLKSYQVRQIWAVFGDEATEVLNRNPWKLLQLEGISFEQADGVARRLGLDLACSDRLKGAAIYACRELRSFGHVYTRLGKLTQLVSEMVGGAETREVAKAIVENHQDGSLVLDRDTKPGTKAVYEPWLYLLEVESAAGLIMRNKSADPTKEPGPYCQALASVGPLTEKAVKDDESLASVVDKAVEDWGSQAKLQLTDTQRQGVVNALIHPVSILTGLPGTGKTTSLRAAVRILQDSGTSFLLCAPTGIAAKNLSHVTGASASTIHRAFSARGASQEDRDATYAGVVGGSSSSVRDMEEGTHWGYNQDRPYPAKVVVVDEASMLDQHLLYRLLDGTSPDCRLVFVGDHAQLPSVGPGNVLRDLIKSKVFPVTKLTEIFRQDKLSDIVPAAHAIHAGEIPETGPPGDFSLIELPTEQNVLDFICKLCVRLYKSRREFQVLSPRHAGVVGVTNLNSVLRDLLNPKSPGLQEMQVGRDVIREDDRVMVVKNNYSLGVYNGDVGKISRMDPKAREVEVKIFGDPPKQVRFGYSTIGKHIRLAYATTIHKAQGLSYDYIIMPIVDGFGRQLKRNLLYTAVTRARKSVFLIGTRTAFSRSILNDREDMRDTLLVERIRISEEGCDE